MVEPASMPSPPLPPPPPLPAVDGGAAAPGFGSFGGFFKMDRPKLRVTSEYDSESSVFFNKISCKLLDNLAKLKLTFQNGSNGEVSEPQIFLKSKFFSLQYDVEESDALLKASYEIAPGLLFRAAHEVKVQFFFLLGKSAFDHILIHIDFNLGVCFDLFMVFFSFHCLQLQEFKV